MPMSYAERVAAQRRLLICQILREAPEYRVNNAILHAMLREEAVTTSRDRMAADIDWLAEAGLVETEELAGKTARIVTLTERGDDVATGAATVSGVARPGPGQ